MVPRSTPASFIHTCSVEPDSASGSPEEKPSSSTISTRGCRYTARLSRQEVAAAFGSGFADASDVASGAVIAELLSDSAAKRLPSLGLTPLPFLSPSSHLPSPHPLLSLPALFLYVPNLPHPLQFSDLSTLPCHSDHRTILFPPPLRHTFLLNQSFSLFLLILAESANLSLFIYNVQPTPQATLGRM